MLKVAAQPAFQDKKVEGGWWMADDASLTLTLIFTLLCPQEADLYASLSVGGPHTLGNWVGNSRAS